MILQLNQTRRRHWLQGILVVLLLSIAATTGIARENTSSAAGADIDAEPMGREFVREGTKLNRELGKFHTSGDRLTFHSSDGRHVFQVLENLALERISDVMATRLDDRDDMIWEVSGTVTEYRGSNYLFIQHVMFRRVGANFGR